MPSILHDRNAVSTAIELSSSIKEVLENLGLRAAGGNYKALSDACKRHSLKLPTWQQSPPIQSKIPLSEILVENSTYNRSHLKKRLIEENALEEVCSSCNHRGLWNDQPLVLQLDHINGIHNDNRIENLTLLCPNCHSQTSTFAGRANKGSGARHSSACIDCAAPKGKNGLRCRKCAMKRSYANGTRTTKIEWPSNEELLERLKDSNYTQLAKELGVSDNALRKRLRC